MIPTPIRQVLSTIRRHQVQALLMGGQACVFCGAAQFSKDVDLARKYVPLALLAKTLVRVGSSCQEISRLGVATLNGR